MSIRFEIQRSRLENNHALIEWFKLFAKQALRDAQHITSERINTHGGSGEYERSFTFILVPGSPPKLIFGNSASHAIYVEEDTVRHWVEPVKKLALRWFDPPGGGEGAAVFSMGHWVPATKGKHIVRDAVTSAGAKLRGTHL